MQKNTDEAETRARNHHPTPPKPFKNHAFLPSPAFPLEMATAIPTPAIGNSFQSTPGKKSQVDAEHLTPKNHENP